MLVVSQSDIADTCQHRTPQTRGGLGGGRGRGRNKGRESSKSSAPVEAENLTKAAKKSVPKWAFEGGQALKIPKELIIQRWNDTTCVCCGQKHKAGACPKKPEKPGVSGTGAGSKKE